MWRPICTRRCWQVGGTISGEHGDGLSRTWFLRQQFGPLYDVFRQIKQIFDPQNIFNPGKVVADAPQPLTANLRRVAVDRSQNAVRRRGRSRRAARTARLSDPAAADLA